MRLIILFIGICVYEALMKISDKDFELKDVLDKNEKAIIGFMLYAFILDILEIISSF